MTSVAPDAGAVTALSPAGRDELALADKGAPGRGLVLSTTSAIYLGFAFRDLADLVVVVLLTASDATESVLLFAWLRSEILFDPEAIGSLVLIALGECGFLGDIGGGVGSANRLTTSW